MNDPKNWLVLGADAGLGPSAIKYLVSHGHHVLGIPMQELHNDQKNLVTTFEGKSPDYIINNSNYYFLGAVDTDVSSAVLETVKLVKAWSPLLDKKNTVNIINLPPQLCLSTLEEPESGIEILNRMDRFLKALHQALLSLPYKLNFIEPGERFMQF